MVFKQGCPPPTLAAGARLHGFRIRRIEQVPEIRVTLYEGEHEKTGALLLHLHSDDRENLFSIGFRTPPRDSTGVPHILEHSVLAGSERYPLKDVFNELLKGSLQTFLNAFTYPDKTIYPVASQDRRDFFNLARVYADLVLRPRLRRETFLQEGHHLEFAADGTPSLSGIVFNEMKGVYSSPESLMYKALQENLYPESPYAFDSGGDPERIPDLTYEQFREFHRTYYSPTNARFFLYGDIPIEAHLRFLNGILAGIGRVAVDSTIALQPRWSGPRSVHGQFPVGEDEETAGKTTVNLAWMTAPNTDARRAMLLTIVADLLVGSAASPLRKALIDSRLGEDLSPLTGLERDLAQIAFAVGLRGTEPDRSPAIEALILETLQKVAAAGFDRELVEGTLHQIEFHGRELVRSAYPYGIVLMGRAYHTWLYDGDPLAELNFPRTIAAIRQEWGSRPALFQEVLRTELIENPHRLLSVMEPSRTYQREREEEAGQRLAALNASLTPEAKQALRAETEAMQRFQSEPDTPEAAATLPRLSPTEISREIETIPTEGLNIGGVPALRHELFANGIVYLDLSFDVSALPEELQPWLPLLGKLTTQMGAAGLTYEEMAKRISLKTGGLGAKLATGITADGTGDWQQLCISVKALTRNIDEAVAVVRDILTAGDLDDAARMQDLLLEKKNGLRASVVPSGHLFAQMAAAAELSRSGRRSEQWHGRTQLRFLTDKTEGFPAVAAEVRQALRQLREALFTRSRLRLNLTAEAEGLDRIEKAAEFLVGALPEGESPARPPAPARSPSDIGIAIPAQVCYVAKALTAPPYRDELAAPLYVLARFLSNGDLYRRIRVRGGAYGGACRYEPLGRLFAFFSYRDPHLSETLDHYREAVAAALASPIPAEELDKAVIGAVGALDRPLDPAGRGYTALIRDLSSLTDDDRRRFRSAVLDVTADQLRGAARQYFPAAEKEAVVAVCAAEDRLRKANETLEKPLRIEKLP